jgi:hypothetical protein
MKRGYTAHFLLALAFAIGQWFAVVHGTQHELGAGDKAAACEICALGHASAAPPKHVAPSAVFIAGAECPAPSIPVAPRPCLLQLPPARGPPLVLV